MQKQLVLDMEVVHLKGVPVMKVTKALIVALALLHTPTIQIAHVCIHSFFFIHLFEYLIFFQVIMNPPSEPVNISSTSDYTTIVLHWSPPLDFGFAKNISGYYVDILSNNAWTKLYPFHF